MLIRTKYDVGQTVKFRNYRGGNPVADGEIVRITIGKEGAIRYTIQYLLDDEWLQAEVWEDDLATLN